MESGVPFSDIGKDTKITKSVVGDGCKIGSNVSIEGCYIWNDVTIEDGCKLRDSVLLDGAVMKSGAVLEPGVVLSYDVVVGKGIVVPSRSKVCLLPQTDGDEHGDDSNSWIRTDRKRGLGKSDMGEDGIGFIWPLEKVEDEEPTPEVDTKTLEKLFLGMVENIFLKAVDIDADRPVHLAYTIEELRALRVGFGMYPGECAGALLHSIMKFAVDTSNKSGNDLAKETDMVISKWQELLKPFTRFGHEQVQVVSKFEEMCLESMKEYAPLFAQVLYILYEKDIIQEEAIVEWANKKDADESHQVFVKQSAERFIQCLKEAVEED